jgi:hypothetical protein
MEENISLTFEEPKPVSTWLLSSNLLTFHDLSEKFEIVVVCDVSPWAAFTYKKILFFK